MFDVMYDEREAQRARLTDRQKNHAAGQVGAIEQEVRALRNEHRKVRRWCAHAAHTWVNARGVKVRKAWQERAARIEALHRQARGLAEAFPGAVSVRYPDGKRPGPMAMPSVLNVFQADESPEA